MRIFNILLKIYPTMLIFFGSRSTKIKEGRLTKSPITCSHCDVQNTFRYTVFGGYFHVFFIPMFPLGKTTIIECSHCKKTYSENDELPIDIQNAIERQNEADPPKRPLWHGCGCLVIFGPIIISLVFSILGGVLNFVGGMFSSDSDDSSPSYIEEVVSAYDPFENDLKLVTNEVSEDNPITSTLQGCISLSIQGIDTDDIKYYTKVNHNKILVILKVTDLGNIKRSSRRTIVEAVEECLNVILEDREYYYYIAVDGKWNLLMTKSPTDEDLGGSLASPEMIMPFYDDYPFGEIVFEKPETKIKDSINN